MPVPSPSNPPFVPEILSPAGNPEKLKIAIKYGAEALYLAGKRFGLRTFGKNFSDEELSEGIKLASESGVKIYVTLNSLVSDDEMSGLLKFAGDVRDMGASAVIVSDPGVFSELRKNLPKLPVHVSTQANTSSAAACKFWAQQGASRIILSRELSLKQIIKIREIIGEKPELECFVHGSMCLAHSGRCLLSAYFNGRSANRGACTQPCRWSYSLTEALRGGEDPLEIEEDHEGTYLLSSKDLCMLFYLPELIKAGISSFKIEGRMKGLYYAAMATKLYREARDTALSGMVLSDAKKAEWKRELELLTHREYSTGFYFESPRETAQLSAVDPYINKADVLGISIERKDGFVPEGFAMFRQMNKFSKGDEIEIVGPPGFLTRKFNAGKLLNEDGDPVESVPHASELFFLDTGKIPSGCFLRKVRTDWKV